MENVIKAVVGEQSCLLHHKLIWRHVVWVIVC